MLSSWNKRISFKIFPLFMLGMLILSVFPLSFAQATTTFISVPFEPNKEVNLEITYSINYEAKSPFKSIFQIWIPRLNTWTSADSTQYTIQKSDLIDFNHPDFYNNYTFDMNDVYGNSYDYYDVEMNPLQQQTTFSYNATYNVSLFSHNETIPSNLDINEYNFTDPVYHFYTSQQPFYEINDSEVQELVSSITHNSTNLKQIVESIYLFVLDSMNYTSMNDVLTLKEIMDVYAGDCSEFSTLMVGLLRAAGIPARKVLGMVLIDGSISDPIPKYNIKAGETWKYSLEEDNLIPGHAWVQYYIPNRGWQSADPTWGKPYYAYGNESALQYLYQIDYTHLITTIGGWYEQGIDPPLEILEENATGIPEFPFIYPLGNSPSYQFDFEIQFKVLSGILPAENIFTDNIVIILAITSGSFMIILFLCAGSLFSRKNRKRRNYPNFR